MMTYVQNKPKTEQFYDLHNRLKKMDFDEIVENTF